MAETETKPQEQAGAAQQNVQSAAVPQQQKPCPKDCGKCSIGHQIYCTAKMTFDSFSVLSHIIGLIEMQSAKMDALTGKMDALAEKVDAQSAKIAELSGRISVIESEKSEFSTPQPIDSSLFKEE